MPFKKTIIAQTEPLKRFLTASERRAAQVAEAAGKQAQLKLEAAERRARRAPPD
jgi:hypothetical protein